MAAQRPVASLRQTYGETLLTMADAHPDLVVLGGDLNVSTFTHLWRDRHPRRFFDFGPAEQNMVAVGAGLAASGKLPFVSTFSVFGVGRPFDQLRVLVAQPALNFKLVCTHAGIMTGEDGMSAHGIEDLSLICALPTFTVISPSDAVETAQAVQAAAAIDGPVYIRLSRAAVPVIHSAYYRFNLGQAERMREGSDLTLIATGIMSAIALDAADLLSDRGLQARVLNIPTLKPIDQDAVIAAARETGALVTAEEHYIHGGLGSIIAQIAGSNCPVPLEMVALHRYSPSGKPEELLARNGLTPENLRDAAIKAVARKKGL